MFERITEAEINERSMANVSTTPGRRTAFGEGGLDAKALKLRFDRLGRYLAKRLNEVFDGIADGSLAEVLYIDSEGKKRSLKDFVDSLLTGQVESIKIQTSDGVITLTELGDRTQEMYNGLDTGDLAGKIKIIEGVTLKKFYEDFLKLEDNISPVKSVNGKTGEVKLSAKDVGARPDSWLPTPTEIGAEASGTAATAVSGHNVQTDAHNDIRIELQRLAGIIADILDSDDATLDEMHEIVAYIKSNKALIDAITTSKVNVADIINNLDTNVSDKPLSAAQGVVLKALIDEKGNGSSTESMLGEWEFNDEITITPKYGGINIVFMCEGVKYVKIADEGDGVYYYDENGEAWSVYYYNGEWERPSYRNIQILEEPSAEVAACIKANAKRKQPVGVDKIKSIDTWWGDTYEAEDTGEGITWSDTFALLDKDGNEISAGEIHQKVPIKAGDNIRFEQLPDGIVIHATGGGSSTPSVSLIGTWTVIEDPEIPESDIPLEFTSNGTEYIGIGSTSMGSSYWGINALSYISPGGYYDAAYVNNPSESYGITHGWRNGAFRYLTVTKEPESREAIAWLGNNTDAPKVKLEKEQMPQIRFANFTEYKNEEDMTMYRFTVENLGGGTLQAGDKLQICCRRKNPGGKRKLRQMTFYEITEEDINQRFLKIEVDPNEETVQKWLFKNDRVGKHHTMSAMYFRLKRAIKYDGNGKECDAIFSNVETVWKTFAILEGENGKEFSNLKIK